MLNRICAAVALVVGMGLAWIFPVYAHHSASSEYDVERTIQVIGVMTKMDWINPHALMHLDVKDNSGNVTKWDASFAGLSKLRLAGMNRESLVVGQKYTIIGNPARQGRHIVLVNRLVFPDGHIFQMGQDTLRDQQ